MVEGKAGKTVTSGKAKRDGIVVDNIPLDPPMKAERAQRLTRRYEARQAAARSELAKTMDKGKGKASSLETLHEPWTEKPSTRRKHRRKPRRKPRPSAMDEDYGDALLPGLPEADTAPRAEAPKASSSSAPNQGKRSVSPISSSSKQKGKAAAAGMAYGPLQETSADPAAVELHELTATRVEGERVQDG